MPHLACKGGALRVDKGHVLSYLGIAKVIWLGGAKSVDGEGNTAVSVFNPWFDPDAANIVLQSGVQLTMITTDAARDVTLDPDVFDQLAKHGNALGKIVAGPLQMYASVVETQNRFGKPRVALFDPTAVVVALHPDYITDQQSGLVVIDPAAGFRPPADLCADIVWFDAFVTNVDRDARNTNMLVWHKRLWLIDHGSARVSDPLL